MKFQFLKGKAVYACAALVLGVGALAACATVEPLQVQGDAVQRYEGENVDMRVEFLDDPFLKARFGERANPFVAPPGITNERFLVFELEVRPLSAVRLDLSDAELRFEPALAGAQNRFQFNQHWQLLDADSRLSAMELRRRETTINAEIFANQTALSGGDAETGLLVFRGRFPRYGTAVITVPVRELSGRPLERATFEFAF